MKLSDMLQAREDRKYLKELRKLKKQEMYNDYEDSKVTYASSSLVVSITLISLFFCAVLAFALDIELGALLGCTVIAIVFAGIFIEAFIRSTFEVVSEFVQDNLANDSDRKRAYRETRKVIDYAIKNDKLSEEQITMMIEGLVYNAKAESNARVANRLSVIANNPYEAKSSVNDENVIEANAEVVEDKEEEAFTELTLVFNEEDMSIMAEDKEVERVRYDEIVQPTTEEEISSMPYSTIYGYVKRADKTIYIDMEKESAIIK